MYSFGGPRVGNNAFAALYDTLNTFRLVLELDLITTSGTFIVTLNMKFEVAGTIS